MSLPHQLAALLVAFIWGTNFILIKIGLAELPPFLFVALRFALVAFPLILFLPRPQVKWSALASYGFLIGFGQFGLLFWVMQANMSPGLAALVIQMQVFFTILLAASLYEERLKKSQLGALSVSAVGLLIIMFKTSAPDQTLPNGSLLSQTTLLGIIVTLVAAMSWAAGNIVVKKVGKVNIIAFIAWSSIFAIPPLLLMSLYYEGPTLMLSSLKSASLAAWAILLWQTIGNTLLGYGLWNWLLHQYSAVKVTPWALLVPVFGLSASSFWLGEPMPWWKLLATLLILSGLVLNLRASRSS